jgi:hypothetical protein
MLKFTPVVIGILATVSIVQPTFAMSAANRAANVNLPDSNRHAQLIIKIGDDHGDGYRSVRAIERRRYWERERERQIERARWEARQRRIDEYRREYRRGYRHGYRNEDDRYDGYRR